MRDEFFAGLRRDVADVRKALERSTDTWTDGRAVGRLAQVVDRLVQHVGGLPSTGRPAGRARTASTVLRDLFAAASERGLTQSALAGALGISQQRVSGYRLGKHEPGILHVEEMADVLGFRLALVPKEADVDDQG